jgi:hypothetical protein
MVTKYARWSGAGVSLDNEDDVDEGDGVALVGDVANMALSWFSTWRVQLNVVSASNLLGELPINNIYD